MPSAKNDLPSPFERVLPRSLHVGKDRLMMRLDFYSEAIVMQEMDKKGGGYKMVSAHDLAEALCKNLSFSSGLLPENTLWWANTNGGAIVALWVPPGMRRLALQEKADSPPVRFEIPLPGLIFLCRPGQPPKVYAAYDQPRGPKARVYKAPLANVYDDGRTCPGNHRYPADIGEIPDSFFKSFFSPGANLQGRSKKHPENIIKVWMELHRDQKKEYPLLDLVYHGTVADLMRYSL